MARYVEMGYSDRGINRHGYPYSYKGYTENPRCFFKEEETLTLQDILKQEIKDGGMTDFREKIAQHFHSDSKYMFIKWGSLYEDVKDIYLKQADAIIALLVQSQPNQTTQEGSK